MVDEQWLPVSGYEHLYEVSNLGNVRRGSRILKPTRLAGYLRLTLCANGKPKSWRVHTLVAAAFLGSRQIGQEVRHLDGDGLNNHADNLAYGTKTDNEADKRLHGTDFRTRQTHCLRGHPLSGDNLYVQPGRPNARACRACAAMRALRRRDKLSGMERNDFL